MHSLLKQILDHPSIRAVADVLGATEGEGPRSAGIYGLTSTGKAALFAALSQKLARPLLVLTTDNERADTLRRSTATFKRWLGGAEDSVDALPFFDVTPYEGRSPHPEIAERRAITLSKIAERTTQILFTPSIAVLGRFRSADYYRSLVLSLAVGDELAMEDLSEHLAGVGYEIHEPVESVGGYSARGGIIDLFSPRAEWPVRIEFSADQIDSIREYDPETQRSRRPIKSIRIFPLVEHRVSPRMFHSLVRALEARTRETGKPDEEPAWAPEYSVMFPGWEFFAWLAEPHPYTLFSLFDRPVVVWDEPAETRNQIQTLREAWAAAYDEVRDVVPPRVRPEDLLYQSEEFQRALAPLPQLTVQELEIQEAEISPTADADSSRRHSRFTLRTQPAPQFRGNLRAWVEDLQKRRQAGENVAVAASTAGEIDRLCETLQEYSLPYETVLPGELTKGADSPHPQTGLTGAPFAPGVNPPDARPLQIVRGSLDEGVMFPDVRLSLFCENDLFGRAEWTAARIRGKSAISRFISDLSDLRVGDYVVHVDHGVGLYQGLRQIAVDGSDRDFMLLTYQDDAKLYVPLERLDLVDKYRSGSGQDGAKPSLDRLGGTAWVRTKIRVKRALRDMTEELLRLYAERKMSGGAGAPPDTPWQKEFEEAFEFEETPDQLKALEEIKSDLESPQPMDRLLCGDVGYGKTELAMRAAFKVVQGSKQVAVLAPTTVLAFQHYNTFRRRMAAFPLSIEMLSRFRSAAQQNQILADVADGKVDVLIGTHRMLSKDVQFRDLGLLVVDEEQRFGVAAKEKLKRLKANVDVLTMSATPIPRTLHMSLGGLRDLSVIESPPRGRLAIQTTVAAFTPRLIQSAILQEIERQGQVYFVHNRVESIFNIAAMIQRLVPNARLGVAHGQMGEGELERVMLKFVENQYDVLVSTSIIENGLDIARANTLIVNRADRFGLAELYQLRGRVGRSDRRAYAYFLISDEDSLTPIARRRLAALKEFSDLGAGFRLAGLDLELRGAGNILGAEQSGHLASIGLDLYLKMLDQTVEELKGEPPRPETHTTLNLGADIRIPGDYISDESQRLRMYKRISGLRHEQDVAEVEAEMTDRYGPLPESVHTLLKYAILKSLAESMMIVSIDRKASEVWVRFDSQTPLSPESLMRFVHKRRGSRLRPGGILVFPSTLPDPTSEIASVLRELSGRN